MSDTTITSIISLSGVIISVLFSFLAARLQSRNELKKMRQELEFKYSSTLTLKRIEIYPKLYRIISSYAKIIGGGQADKQNLGEFINQLNEWDSENSIFFTQNTIKLAGKFRKYVSDLYAEEEEITKKEGQKLKGLIRYYEDAIRAEIGVLELDPAGTLEDFNSIYNIMDDFKNG